MSDAALLMDRMYRRQRHIYDATRKFYLLGRDDAIAALAPGPGEAVLEIGCGTGRNLIAVARRFPQAQVFGLDVSSEMLGARARRSRAPGLKTASPSPRPTRPISTAWRCSAAPRSSAC